MKPTYNHDYFMYCIYLIDSYLYNICNYYLYICEIIYTLVNLIKHSI